MSRIYETAEDRRREKLIAQAFAAKFGLKGRRHVDPNDEHPTPDFLFWHPENKYGRCFAEIKRRYNRFNSKDVYYFIDEAKIIKLRAFDEWKDEGSSFRNGLVIVGFDDVFGHFSCHQPYKFVGPAGRTDRNDPDDIDQCAHYRWGVFTIDGERGDLYPLDPVRK